MLRILYLFYIRASGVISSRNSAAEITSSNGVLQGDILSPLHFSREAYLDIDVSSAMSVNALFFADDTVILAHSDVRLRKAIYNFGGVLSKNFLDCE